jgi:signal transduction histidine kinase
MSFERISRASKTIGFRLAVWSSSFFVVSTLIVFGLAYTFASSSLQQRDRQSIQLELGELATQYRAGGVRALEQARFSQERPGAAEPFVIRVVGPDARARFVRAPGQWSDFDLHRLDTTTPAQKWILLSARRGDRRLEVASLRMPDGAVLQVGKTTENREEVLERFRGTAAAVVTPVLVLGCAGGLFLAFWALRPLRHMIQTVRAIDAGAMHARVPIRQTGDELDQLSLLFNGMLDRIATLIAGMREALDAVAHDLRTPVARIRGVAELALRSDQEPDAFRQSLADCVEESDQLLTMLNTLMDISEAETGALKLRLERVNVAILVETIVDLYRLVADEKRVTVSTAADPQLWLTADRTRLRQVLGNLLDNAIKYTAAGGRVEVKAQQQQESVVISISDTGMGLAPDELPKIWDRLYRGDQARAERGLGLGLSLVRAVVQAHGGRIDVSSAVGVGSIFTISLLPSIS